MNREELLEQNTVLRAEIRTLRAIGERLTSVLRDRSLTAWEHNLLIVADEAFCSRAGWHRCVGLTFRPPYAPVRAEDAHKARGK